MKILYVRDTLVNGKHKTAGHYEDVDEDTGKFLVTIKKAVEYTTAEAKKLKEQKAGFKAADNSEAKKEWQAAESNGKVLEYGEKLFNTGNDGLDKSPVTGKKRDK